MERDNRKRGRSEKAAIEGGEQQESRREKKQKSFSSSGYYLEEPDISKISSSSFSDTHRPFGVFEFPWQKEKDARHGVESESWDLREVFFSSLVDGSSAKIGFPGDRLGRALAPFTLLSEDGSWPFDEDIDGVDCIWSSVLRQPLWACGSAKASNE